MVAQDRIPSISHPLSAVVWDHWREFSMSTGVISQRIRPSVAVKKLIKAPSSLMNKGLPNPSHGRIVCDTPKKQLALKLLEIHHRQPHLGRRSYVYKYPRTH